MNSDRTAIPEERRAPKGMIWRCSACGKEAEDRYGMIGARSYGWDESCMLNAALRTRPMEDNDGK